jgi:hypothetical protein
VVDTEVTVAVEHAEVVVDDADVSVDDAKVTVDGAKSTVGERVLCFSSMDKGREETSLWAVPHPITIKPHPTGWQLPWKAPRFAGVVGQTGRLAA